MQLPYAEIRGKYFHPVKRNTNYDSCFLLYVLNYQGERETKKASR